MRHTRLRAAAAVAVLLVALLLLASPASADVISFDYTTVEGLSQPQYETVTETYRVPMHDGVELYVEVVRPDAEGRFPVVMEVSPYHGTLHARTGTRIFPDPVDEQGNAVGLTGYFAPRGYAVVMVDLRGTGRSQGCLDHLGDNDAKDLKRVVEWAADQEWSSGRVGMTGHSYVGSTPIVAAAQRPRGLVTIAPSAGLASMYDHQFQYGVPYYLQWAGPQWAYEVLAMERHLPPGVDTYSQGGDNFGNDMEYFGCGWQNSAFTSGSGQVTGQYGAWHGERDWREEAAEVDIPVFMIHGVNDDAARIPAAEWFFADRTPRAYDKVWLGQWNHGGNTQRCRVEHPNCRFEQWQYALHAWFDRHLQQRDVETGPPVEVFLNGDVVYTPPRWDAVNSPWTLHADGTSLSAVEPAAAGERSFTGAAQLASGTYVDYTSEAVEQETLVSGMPQVRLAVSTTGPVQLVATLYEKNQGGVVDVNNPISVCAIQPLLRYGAATVAPVVPGEVMELEPQCFTAAHLLEAGDQVVLRVTTANRSSGSHHAPTSPVDAQVTVHAGPDATRFTLPTVANPAYTWDVLTF